MKSPHAWYGFRRDHRDARDRIFNPAGVRVPRAVDLRANCPPVMNQGAIGSCTAHGILGMVRHGLLKTGQPDNPLSRLQLYYDERRIEGTISSDAGAEIRDGIKSLLKEGVAPEWLWPYKTARYRTKPPASVYAKSIKFTFKYERVQVDAAHLKAAMASGWPVVIGIAVYDSFDSDATTKTGVVPMPGRTEKVAGGHCMYAVGYGQRPGYFTVRNSWAKDWGDKGDCYIPEAYLGSTKYGADYWRIVP